MTILSLDQFLFSSILILICHVYLPFAMGGIVTFFFVANVEDSNAHGHSNIMEF